MDDKILEKASFGSFRGQVGHKAGGFIAKKKFHPSSMANQEKVWQAREDIRKAKEAKELRQKQHEVQVLEELRKTDEKFVLAGAASGNMDSLVFETVEQQRAFQETQEKLRSLLADSHDERPSKRLKGIHSSCWGSYYDKSLHKWGYGCCKSLDKFSNSCINRY
jgi:hypothetical protein